MEKPNILSAIDCSHCYSEEVCPLKELYSQFQTETKDITTLKLLCPFFIEKEKETCPVTQ